MSCENYISQNKIIIFSAPSGAGKTTILKYLLKKMPEKLGFAVSCTTRKPRFGEIYGKDYYFLSIKDFQQKIIQGYFLEWEEVYPGTFYGTLKSEIDRIWSMGLNVVFDVDVKGFINIKSQFVNSVFSIFIKPPSLKVLAYRLYKRGTENHLDLRSRIDKANLEIYYANKFDKILINQNLKKAKNEAEFLVKRFLCK